MAGSDFSPQTPLIYTATVLEVDVDAYTVRLYSQQKGITMPVEIPSLFTNSRGGNGSGAHFIPEVGAEVWVCETSDGTVVPLQYHGVIGDGSYANNRPKGLPGDIILSTSHGNSISILKGGSILQQASPVCSVLLDPMSDSIRQFSNSYYRYTLSSKEEHICDNFGTRDTESIYTFYDNAESNTPCSELRIGSLASGNLYEQSVGDYYFTSIDGLGALSLTANSSDTTVTTTANVTAPASMTFTTPTLTVTGGIVAASLAVGSISVAPPTGVPLMSSNELGTEMVFGDPLGTDATSILKSGASSEGFLYDLNESLAGLIATVAALQLIVDTIDATVPGVAIQDALDAQGLAIDAQPLVDMKVEVEAFLQTGTSQYTTNKLKSE